MMYGYGISRATDASVVGGNVVVGDVVEPGFELDGTRAPSAGVGDPAAAVGVGSKHNRYRC